MLVAFVDGTYGIFKNGEPLADCQWQEKELDGCIRQLLRLAGRDGGSLDRSTLA